MENPKNQILVIFGASGDLASRKLMPALFSLRSQKLLPEKFVVIGTGRTNFTSEEFRIKMGESIPAFSEEKVDSRQVSGFTNDLYYHTMDNSNQDDFLRLRSLIEEIDTKYGIGGNCIFYMATPPLMYEPIAVNLSKAGLTVKPGAFRRVIIEKPFGYDLESGRKLNRTLHGLIDEDQIFRIDHYLGKETVQNLLVTRFANGMFEPLWNRNYIDRIEITSAESIGVEDRGGYYDSSGALRDMVQNHLLQMVGMTAMEPPSSLDSNAIRNEVLKVLQSLQPVKEEDVPKQVIRGQYTGSLIRGECVTGYRYEKGVDIRSRTETYVAIKFYINNWRWGGVPFYIRTGKRLPTRVTEILIHFKPTPHHLFRRDMGKLSANQLIIRIQPDEGILLKFDMKEPGAGFNVKNVNMDFHYTDLADIRVPSAYERLLYDVMIGDSTLFSRDDEVETAWKFLEPIQKAWANDPSIKIFGYPAGTWGPEHANDLIEGEALTWRYPCKNLADDELYCEL
ncbi:MAG: glucose-6-phosphate dehydrogenase [Bacteroidetes bacterium GWE2_41_25]|nr:MAG: glucose-6-phosphate dehydrogenase [Bacteroidetes bacterium GWA2_40_15]OFY01648.1 MAG: glucose-6-phosphate dehydrogenase [Bacteroidetes bacterium GWE2_41_25]HBQ84768.1 glucose-6-phosphate dehydrogenase [Bacteroidales bacterium]HCU19957.1 glucose-6-phosphate dehydrogenase [Bacteroidales bacterium]